MADETTEQPDGLAPVDPGDIMDPVDRELFDPGGADLPLGATAPAWEREGKL